jgi:hypothetical protein
MKVSTRETINLVTHSTTPVSRLAVSREYQRVQFLKTKRVAGVVRVIKKGRDHAMNRSEYYTQPEKLKLAPKRIKNKLIL